MVSGYWIILLSGIILISVLKNGELYSYEEQQIYPGRAVCFCVLLIAVTSINSSFLTPLRTGVGYFLVPLQSGMNTVGTSLFNNIRDYSSLKGGAGGECKAHAAY